MDRQPLIPPIAVLGAGSWGTALALYLSRRGQPVHIWSVDKAEVDAMLADKANNRYLPGHPFPDTLKPIANLAEAVNDTRDILIAVPSVGFRSTITALKPLIGAKARLICATKGLDENTGQLLHDMAAEILGKQQEFAALSGPSFAKEVAAGLPTAVVAASRNTSFVSDIIATFDSSIFRVHPSDDVVGVEIGAVVKNVVAIATGMTDGMSFGANARSALITQGLEEMIRLGMALGAKRETLIGLAGLGDLILTCTDNQSRNRRLGLAIGKGQSVEEAEKEIGQVVEGKRNAELIDKLAKKHNVTMPICATMWLILQGKTLAKDAFAKMMGS